MHIYNDLKSAVRLRLEFHKTRGTFLTGNKFTNTVIAKCHLYLVKIKLFMQEKE
uniref:Uncharacterized protein n=1 Tax=Rhizophagus irregularis (strain DAOM 181602 / DAOM 197198 / MUCL 43194) TaxID=747089 RepID=U9TKR3_RHIID